MWYVYFYSNQNNSFTFYNRTRTSSMIHHDPHSIPSNYECTKLWKLIERSPFSPWRINGKTNWKLFRVLMHFPSFDFQSTSHFEFRFWMGNNCNSRTRSANGVSNNPMSHQSSINESLNHFHDASLNISMATLKITFECEFWHNWFSLRYSKLVSVLCGLFCSRGL